MHTVNYYRPSTNTNTYIQFRTLNKNYDGEYNVSVEATVNNMRMSGHIERKDEADLVKQCMSRPMN